MEFPITLKTAMETKLAGIKQEQLQVISQEISKRYRKESGTGKRLVTTDWEALVYSLVRMPATFGAVSKALKNAIYENQEDFQTVLDVGAGTGSASWAVDQILSPVQITCLEREPAMRKLGQQLMEKGSEVLQNAQWIPFDLIREDCKYSADLVIASYVMNEMLQVDREIALKKLWKATQKILLIIEPGTPIGYGQLMKSREILLKEGAHIAAPCPHEEPCRIKEGDWCHFCVRVSRSKIHRKLKDAEVSYEDEKFSYVAFIRKEVESESARILRYPFIEKGKISMELCTKTENQKKIFTKKDNSLFKVAKKAEWGDQFKL